MRDRFSLGDVGRGGPLVKKALAGFPPVTAPTRHLRNPANVLTICQFASTKIVHAFRVNVRSDAKRTTVLPGETGAPVTDGFSGQRASIRSRGVFLFPPLRLRPGQHPISSKVPESNLRGLKDMGKGSRVL